jgi:DNA-binding transcriptional ArsR family regulator
MPFFGKLVKSVPVSQPAVSQHLRVLRDARLVRVQRQGQQRVYIDSFRDQVLEAFQEAYANTAYSSNKYQPK